jgi:Lon protease-like protein
MQPVLLPLFPLQAVLFPRTPLPLHIFEERYREMIGEILENKEEFGIVLAGQKGIANMGCTAVVDRVVERYEDGRLDIATSGRRRFEIQSLNEERAFLRGRVEFFDDDDETEAALPSPEDRRRASELWRELSGFAGVEHEPRWDDPQLSFQIADSIPDLDFRQSLLAVRSEARRIRQITEFFPVYMQKQRHVQHIQMVAPRNGHGKRKVEE